MQRNWLAVRFVLLVSAFLSTFANAESVVRTTPLNLSANDITFEGDDLVIDGVEFIVAGSHNFNSLQLINGAKLTHEIEVADKPVITVVTDLLVDSESFIDVSGKGRLPNTAAGVGKRG